MKSRILTMISVLFWVNFFPFSLLAGPVVEQLEVVSNRFAEHEINGPIRSGTYSIENRLGNIRVFHTPGNQIIVRTNGLRHTRESASVRVWEVEPGKFKIEVQYPPIVVVPPAGRAADMAASGGPEQGVVTRGEFLILGGKMSVRGDLLSLGTAGLLTIRGYVGSTDIEIGLPGTVLDLKAESMVGDVIIEALDRGRNQLRGIVANSTAGRVTIAAKTLEGIVANSGEAAPVVEPASCDTHLTEAADSDRKRAIVERFDYDSAKWPGA